jgi:hypothetical protein
MSHAFIYNTRSFAIYKLTIKVHHCPMFHVTHFAIKIWDTYNLTIEPSRLMSRTCGLVFKPVNMPCSEYVSCFYIMSPTNLLPIAYLATISIVGACSTLHFHCSATYKQHSKFRDIQIDRRNPSFFHVLCYTFCSQKFGDIQFDHRLLTSLEYNL